MKRYFCLVNLLFVVLLITTPLPAAGQNSILVTDNFGRVANGSGLTLVDWDGYMANPAIKFYVAAPAEATFPATATLTASNPMLYFDLPTENGPDGPTKKLEFSQQQKKIPVYISAWPDRNSISEASRLSIQFQDDAGMQWTVAVPVHIIDQDAGQPAAYKIHVDFSKDRTGFFDDEAKRRIIQLAVDDWAYFLDPIGFEPVPPDAEQTWIWHPDGFKAGDVVRNASAYIGSLLYVYGISSPEIRSGGEPSAQGELQKADGKTLPMKRSGGVQVEIKGNYNVLGWNLSTEDEDWWKDNNLGDKPNELFTIVHHESAHALFFNPINPAFAQFKEKGYVDDPAVVAYAGGKVRIDIRDHFDGSLDAASRKGAFGYEYHGAMPNTRWIITKLDLLCAQAIGYKLRPTSAFMPLSLIVPALGTGIIGKPYEATLKATGGIPFYNWTVTAGHIPPGLTLDPFSGELAGVPTTAGDYEFTVQVQEYTEGNTGMTRAVQVRVTE